MTQQSSPEQEAVQRPSGRGGYSKPFPTMKFEGVLPLPKSIAEHGLDGEINRRTLFEELKRAPDSGHSKVLVTNAEKYGLIVRRQPGDSLALTDSGRVALAAEEDSPAAAMRFRLAIEQFGPFSALYDKLKGRPFHEGRVLKDELVKAGVAEADRDQAAEVFAANLRFLGLIEDIDGRNHVRDVAEFLPKVQQIPEVGVAEASSAGHPREITPLAEESGKGTAGPERPALHIDIQVHIDPTSSAEQIDQIFASMARHFYGDAA